VTELQSDVLIIGGGTGGTAAALAATRGGATVIMTEPTAWIGGQLTSQAVPPDDHPWIEQFGSPVSYRDFRRHVRDYYRRWYPLRPDVSSQPLLNPGLATVSRLCHEPRVALAVLEGMLAPARAAGRLRILTGHAPVAAETDSANVTSVTCVDPSGKRVTLIGRLVLDATELGDLLPLAGFDYVTGAEAAADTGEPHAAVVADPLQTQGITVCLAMDYLDGEDHTIGRPAQYGFWTAPGAPVRAAPQIGWPHSGPGTLRPNPSSGDPVIISTSYQGRFGGPAGWNPIEDLWRFRRLLARNQFSPELPSDVTIVNWPANDYGVASIIDVSDTVAADRVEAARQLSLSLLYWLQTEAPRPDGGTGFPGLRPRGDITGTPDGLAMAPYIRESRRIRARTTVTEQDIAPAARAGGAARKFPDSVGVGSYRIDLHPSAAGGERLNTTCFPFQIPLGALLPRRAGNLIAAAKNIGTTHITNGAYRVHPVEWGIGEAAGALAAHCVRERVTPHAVHDNPTRLAAFQEELRAGGVELDWPDLLIPITN
jgi:FAD-dependent oxidoreductase family protein